MSIFLAIALLLAAVIGLVFGPEDRPGFDERTPLA
jgi:hypothetical protein